MIYTLVQILGALATMAGSFALFGPWWTLLVFGAVTLIASSVAEAISARSAPDNVRAIRPGERGAS
jgi:hypothetical protein